MRQKGEDLTLSIRTNNNAYIDPGMVMGAIVSLIILAVGVFAFFIVLEDVGSIDNETKEELGNVDVGVAEQVPSMLGLVLVVGAIMTIVGLVYNYVGRPSSPSVRTPTENPTELSFSLTNYEPIEPSRSGNVDVTIDDVKKSIKSGKERRV